MFIVGTPPLIKGGWDLPKIESLGGWGGKKFLARKRINLKRVVDEKMGGLPLFYCFTVTITFTLCVGKARFPLLLFGSSVF